jgi:hypothetical protein
MPKNNTVKPLPSKLGLYGLLGGILISSTYIIIMNLPAFIDSTNTSSAQYYTMYGVLGLAAAICLAISIRSFKCIDYPNITGLIGLVLNLIVLFTVLNSLVSFVLAAANGGGG